MARSRRSPSTLLALLVCVGCDGASLPDIPSPDLSDVSEQTLLNAVDSAQEAVRDAPRSAAAWGALGHVYLIHTWNPEAVLAYRTATELAPDDFRWHYHLGRALERTDPEAALSATARALELDATYPPVNMLHANLLRSLARFQEAAAALARVAELDPRNPFAELGLGQLALANGELEEAQAHIERALALNPGQSEAHQVMAQVLAAAGDPDSAAAHAELARAPTAYVPMVDPLWGQVEAAGATRYYYSLRGQRHLRARDYARAVADLSRAVTPEEKSPMLWYNYGAALLGARRTSEAITVLERALAETDNEEYRGEVEAASMRRIFTNLGLAYTQARDVQSAEALWRRGLEEHPNAAELINNLTALLYNQGRLDDAIEVLENSEVTAGDANLSTLFARLTHERKRGSGNRPRNR